MTCSGESFIGVLAKDSSSRRASGDKYGKILRSSLLMEPI